MGMAFWVPSRVPYFLMGVSHVNSAFCWNVRRHLSCPPPPNETRHSEKEAKAANFSENTRMTPRRLTAQSFIQNLLQTWITCSSRIRGVSVCAESHSQTSCPDWIRCAGRSWWNRAWSSHLLYFFVPSCVVFWNSFTEVDYRANYLFWSCIWVNKGCFCPLSREWKGLFIERKFHCIINFFSMLPQRSTRGRQQTEPDWGEIWLYLWRVL